MDQKRKAMLVGACAVAVAAAIATVPLASNMAQRPAASAEDGLEDNLGNVAKADPETGDKVFIDSEFQVVKQLGEAGKLTAEGEKKPSFEITVDKVRKMETCTLRGFGETITPENGTFLLLDVTATLAKAAAKAVDEEIVLMPLDSSVFGVSSGKNKSIDYEVSTIASYSCVLRNPLDVAVGAGDTVKGQIMLDSPCSSGQMVYDPQKSGGWSWAFKQRLGSTDAAGGTRCRWPLFAS